MSQRQRMINLGIAAVIAVVAIVIIVVASGGSDDNKTADNGQQQVSGGTSGTSQTGGATPGATTTEPQSADEPPIPLIEVKDGKPVGGITKIRVRQGERIRFRVKADVADEVHVHAYDFHKEIEKPGDTVSFDFKANITGITEAELEDAGLQIASIRVDP